MEKRSEDGRHNTNRNVVVLDEKPCFGRYRTTTRKDFIYIFFGCCKRWFFCERFFFFVSYLVRISSTHLQKRIFHDPSSDQILSSSLCGSGKVGVGGVWQVKKGLWWTGTTSVLIWRCDAEIKSWGRDEKADLRWQIFESSSASWIKLSKFLCFHCCFLINRLVIGLTSPRWNTVPVRCSTAFYHLWRTKYNYGSEISSISIRAMKFHKFQWNFIEISMKFHQNVLCIQPAILL